MNRIRPLYNGIRLHATIVSDTHIDRKHPRPWLPQWRLVQVLKDAKQSAVPVDVLMTVGDTTSRSSDTNWRMTKDCFDKVGGAAKKIILPIGNHDGWREGGFEAAKKNYLRYSNMICKTSHTKTYFTEEVNGCRFICLGTDSEAGCEAQFSDEQIEWFENEMESAAKTDKPVFVFCHQSLNCRHGLPKTFDEDEDYKTLQDGGIGERSDEIEAILNKHKNVFFFSGHSHMGFGGEKCLKEAGYASIEADGELTLINLPSLACGNHHGENREFCTGLQLEVYDDRVVLRPRSYKRRSWLSVKMQNGKPYFEKML